MTALRPTRRAFLAGAAAAFPLVSILSRPANAAEFRLKYATGQAVTHPVNIRAQEAIDRIREATSGRVDIRLFPANQLGSDTDLLAQVRSGAVEFFNVSSLILATFVPLSGMTSLGFAFKDYDQVWQAMDGPFGDHIRAEIARRPIFAMNRIWDNGFRQITSSGREIRTPEDLDGFRLRVPPAPALTSLFKALGAGPSPINFNELYTALQTHVVEGQENPLAIIATAKLFEVQKYLSMTNHMWDGFWFLANRRAWERLPADLRTNVHNNINAAAVQEREDVAKLNAGLKDELTQKGMVFNDTQAAPFREALRKAGFYAEWKKKYGDEAWAILEKAVGSSLS